MNARQDEQETTLTGGRSNPFQPPAESIQPGRLAPDTQFLVSDKHIAGTSRIKLPRLCIRTVEQSNLRKFVVQYRHTPTLITNIRNAALFCAIFIGPVMSAASRSLVREFPGLPWEAVGEVISGVSAVIFLALLVAGFLVRESIEVTWFVSHRVLRTYRIRRIWIWTAALAIFLFAWLSNGTGLNLIPVIVICTGIALLISGSSFTRAPRPVLMGKAEGLYVLTGFSTQYLTKLKVMIADYQERFEAR